MRSIDQRIDHLKNQILDGLTQKGILNELQSRFLSNVAQFIQTTDYDVFKLHRERRQTPEYEIAEIVVAQYLKTKNMTHTLQSIIYEFKIDEKEIDPDSKKSSEITNKIKIEKNGIWIHQIINEWIKNKEVLIKQNKEYDRKMVKNRLYQIDNESNIENDDQDNENSNLLQNEHDHIDSFENKEDFSNQNSNQPISKSNENPLQSLDNEAKVGLDPDWVINEDFIQQSNIDIEEEDSCSNDSQNDKPGKPIWIIESPKDNIGSSGEFISDDDEPPSFFSKQGKLNQTDTKPDNSKDISSNVDNKTSSNEKPKIQHNIFLDIDKNTFEENDKTNTTAKGDNIDLKLNNNNNSDDFVDFDQKEANEDNHNQNNNILNSANNDKTTKDNINEQSSFDFDIDNDFEDDSKTNNKNEDKNNDNEEDIFEDEIKTSKDKKEKLLSDEFDEPEKTQKKDINNDDFDDFDEFNDDFDQEVTEPSQKSNQNVKNTKEQKPIISSGSDIDFEVLIDSDPSTIKPSKSQNKSNSATKNKNQESDSSLDFSSGSFDETEKSETKKQSHKQTKKIGSNSSINFDIDFSDDSPAKSNKNEQKKSNNVNESNQSDFDDFDDTSM